MQTTALVELGGKVPGDGEGWTLWLECHHAHFEDVNNFNHVPAGFKRYDRLKSFL